MTLVHSTGEVTAEEEVTLIQSFHEDELIGKLKKNGKKTCILRSTKGRVANLQGLGVILRGYTQAKKMQKMKTSCSSLWRQ